MNWERVNIVSVASITNEPVEAFLGEKIYIATGDLKETLNDDVSEKVTFDNRPSRANLTAKKGDVILARMKGTDKVMVINEETEQYIYSTGFLVLRPNESLDKDFLYYFLRTKTFQREKDSYCTGATQKAINNANFSNNLTIPLPPLSVQKEIVEKLDKAAAIREKSKALLAHYDALAESLFIELFGDPISNEKGWEKKKLGEVCEVRSSRRVFVDELVISGIPFFRGTEIGQLADGEKISPSLFIKEEHYKELKEETGVPKIGDLLLPSICPDGRIFQVLDNNPFYFKDGRVLWIKVNQDKINSVYIRKYLKEKFAKNYYQIASGTTFSELKIFILKDLEIFLPPLSLQIKFAEMVENIEKQKARAKAEIEQSEAVFQALLQESFG